MELSWYKPPLKIKQFHSLASIVRFLLGGRGSGKTTGAAMEAVTHGWHYAGARIIALRKTEASQSDTSVQTFNKVYSDLGALYQENDQTLFRMWHGGLKVRIPSEEAVRRWNKFLRGNPSKSQKEKWLEPGTGVGDKLCSYIEFKGLKDEKTSQNNLRGLECSMLVLIEADLLDRSDFDLAQFCLRWKGADGKLIEDLCCIVESNPPDPRHWIAQLEDEWRDGKHPDFHFWHIGTAENIHNLPANYLQRAEETYRGNPAMYKRMVLGEYCAAYEGKPVFWAFSEANHAREEVPWPKGAYLVIGWDFGAINANTFSAYFNLNHKIDQVDVNTEYWYDMFERYAEGSDTDRQCTEVIDILNTEFPFWNDRDICAGVMHFVDPAGAAKTDKGSSIDILRSHGISCGYRANMRGLQQTIAIYNRLLQAKDPLEKYCYAIDKKCCPILYRASLGAYRYPKEGEPGFGIKDSPPLKGPMVSNTDHIADASRYAKINCLRLAKSLDGQVTAPVGVLQRKLTPNPWKVRR